MTRTIDILIFPDFQLLDAAGPITVFEAAGRDFSGGGAPAREAEAEASYRLRVGARDAGPVTSSAGVQMVAETFAGGRPDCPDTLIVAGGWGTRAASACDETLAYIRAAAGQTRRIVSVCSGAFILAATGLLDGRRATTHWNRAAELARAYPRVRVEPDRIFIRDGAVWTSAGITAGIDLALALVADDLGEAAAKRAAQHLVVYHRRPGGQSQFSALLEADRPGSRFSPLLCWARERLDERLPVERLAERAAMSPRHFARAFAAETGMTPAKAIERLRLQAARESGGRGAPAAAGAAPRGAGGARRADDSLGPACGRQPAGRRRSKFTPDVLDRRGLAGP